MDWWRGDPPASEAHNVDLIPLWRVRQILQPQGPLPSGEGGSGGTTQIAMRERREEEVVDTKDSKVMVACWSRDVIFLLWAWEVLGSNPK